MSRRVTDQRKIRHARVRAKVFGTAAKPRLSVFRSNRFIYAQLIDDQKGVTLVAADSRSVKDKNEAQKVGEALARAAAAKNISVVVFDRGGYRYQGRVKQLADGARSGGLKF